MTWEVSVKEAFDRRDIDWRRRWQLAQDREWIQLYKKTAHTARRWGPFLIPRGEGKDEPAGCLSWRRSNSSTVIKIALLLLLALFGDVGSNDKRQFNEICLPAMDSDQRKTAL
ncbi:unnamed protein product [Nezara viridula]|uniref:Uncharacterized protein n=1 Tax=Nezara viridula TaxID=85310 RepID=A0A9P0EBF2_NEZVI|nr:unnamed protein product [Nezara viridula]